MELISLRHQLAIFGSFDDILPNVDTIKYFIDTFGDKNFVPSQFGEISLDLSGNTVKNNNYSRLSLTSTDSAWNIRFNSDRIDFALTNNNIGKVQMLSTSEFINEVQDIVNKVDKKFPKKFKRLGLVTQYLIRGIDINQASNKANKTLVFFNDKQLAEWSNKAATRITIQESEVINITNDLKWIKENLREQDKYVFFDGLSLTIDINTIVENLNYRFTVENFSSLLNNFISIEEELKSQNTHVLNSEHGH